MYSEIKSQKQILINRLDDSERILLKEIYNTSKNADISLQELTGETGDFDGVMLNVVPKDLPELDITIPTELDVFINETSSYVFPVSEDATILVNSDNEDLKVYTAGNVLHILADKELNGNIRYEIDEEGYKHLHGEIKVTATTRDVMRVSIDIIPVPDRMILVDSNLTEYNSVDGIYELPIGKYRVFASKLNFELVNQEFEITQEDLDSIKDNEIKTIEIEMISTSKLNRVEIRFSQLNLASKSVLTVKDENNKIYNPVNTDLLFATFTYHLPVGTYTVDASYNHDELKSTQKFELTEVSPSTTKTITVTYDENTPGDGDD